MERFSTPAGTGAFRFSLFFLVGALLLGSGPTAAAPAWAGDVDPACPPRTVKAGSQCVLQGDVDLSDSGTLEVGSYTHLNCRGHRIFTSRPGTDIRHRSNPEVGVLLKEAYGVTIQNCVIDGFDFPVFALDAKVAPGTKNDAGALDSLANNLINNTVTGRYTGITLIDVDNTRIKDSSITFTTENGVGVLVLRDSDWNQIKNNTIAARLNNDASGVVRLPGPVQLTNPLNPPGGSGIYITQGSGLPNLVNAVIGGRLFQFPTSQSPVPDETFSADNLVEGNTITSIATMNDVGASVTQRLTVRGNTLGAARIAVLFGAVSYETLQQFPVTCSGDPTRLCLSSGDCFISGVDAASKGSCPALAPPELVHWISEDPVIEDNRIAGPFFEGIQVASPRALIQGNDITGPVWPGTDFTSAGGTGIDLRRLALQSATVTRNRVWDFVAPIRLLSNSPFFGAKVSLNDFYPGREEILAASSAFSAELSDGTGNYWGLSCSDHAGFDPERVIVVSQGMVDANGIVSITGTPTANIRDSHPYGVPVARLDAASLPSPCPDSP